MTNISGSGFGHNLDVVVLKPPEFILLASGSEVEGTRPPSLVEEHLAPAQ